MREDEIRAAVLAEVRRLNPDPDDTLIIEELGVCLGVGRVDIAAINGHIAGYEIKSAADNLARLPRQVDLFGKVADLMTVVCAPAHRRHATTIVPRWWGLMLAESGELTPVREPRPNPAVSAECMLQLLWKQELEAAARAVGVRGISRATRVQLTRRLAAEMSDVDAKALVRAALRTRSGWRDPP